MSHKHLIWCNQSLAIRTELIQIRKSNHNHLTATNSIILFHRFQIIYLNNLNQISISTNQLSLMLSWLKYNRSLSRESLAHQAIKPWTIISITNFKIERKLCNLIHQNQFHTLIKINYPLLIIHLVSKNGTNRKIYWPSHTGQRLNKKIKWKNISLDFLLKQRIQIIILWKLFINEMHRKVNWDHHLEVNSEERIVTWWIVNYNVSLLMVKILN